MARIVHASKQRHARFCWILLYNQPVRESFSAAMESSGEANLNTAGQWSNAIRRIKKRTITLVALALCIHILGCPTDTLARTPSKSLIQGVEPDQIELAISK